MPDNTISITPEMLQAGAAVLRTHYGEHHNHANIAGDVYLAMCAQADAAARQSEKPDEPRPASTLPPNEWR